MQANTPKAEMKGKHLVIADQLVILGGVIALLEGLIDEVNGSGKNAESEESKRVCLAEFLENTPAVIISYVERLNKARIGLETALFCKE